MNIKINGVDKKTPNIDTFSNSLSVESDNLSKLINEQNVLTAIKAAESMCGKSTESIGEKLESAMITIKNKLIEWFRKLIEFFKNLSTKIILSNRKYKHLSDMYKRVLDKLHNFSIKNIETLSKKEISSEEIEVCKGNQKICDECRKILMTMLKGTAWNSWMRKLSDEDYKSYIDKVGTFVGEFLKFTEQFADNGMLNENKNNDVVHALTVLNTVKDKFEKWVEYYKDKANKTANKPQPSQQ
jgi:hypothetical protein